MPIADSAHPRTLLLDALGTIVDLQPPAPALRSELADRFGIHVSPAQAQRALSAEIAYYRAHLDRGRDRETLAALRRRCAEVLRAALPPSRPLAQLDTAALTEALLASLRFAEFPDVREALLAARSRSERVVVVSNWDISLGDVLERLGLTSLIDGVVTSAAAGARKPLPSIFRRALDLAGTNAESATHVGDSLEADVGGARAAGIAPVLLRRGGEPGPPGVRTIASLAELA
jgi:putative hydrolase of the HAD superfamily